LSERVYIANANSFLLFQSHSRKIRVLAEDEREKGKKGPLALASERRAT
jgi:hypothetical protein